MKRQLIILLALLSALVLTGCATRRQLQVVERTSVDTVYQSNVHYDSIYVSQDKYIDRSRDTLLIKDKTVEYRYRLLRDTVYKTRIDSIPYRVTVVETKEIAHPLTFFDRLCRLCFYLLSGALLMLFTIFMFKLKTRIHL